MGRSRADDGRDAELIRIRWGNTVNRKVFTAQMRRMIGATSLALLAVTGCSESENVIQPVAITTPKANPVALSPNNAKVPTEALTDSPAVPDAETIEFPSNVNFFAVPTTQVARRRTTSESIDRQKTIQLVGFVNEKPSDQQASMALLRVDDRLTCVGVGDSFSEITVVSIRDRSVELVRGKDRWTLAMMQQPITNEPVTPLATVRRTSRSNRSTRNTRSRTPRAEELRVPDVVLPSMPEPNLDLPVGPSLPAGADLPDLPMIPDPEAA